MKHFAGAAPVHEDTFKNWNRDDYEITGLQLYFILECSNPLAQM